MGRPNDLTDPSPLVVKVTYTQPFTTLDFTVELRHCPPEKVDPGPFWRFVTITARHDGCEAAPTSAIRARIGRNWKRRGKEYGLFSHAATRVYV